MTAKKQWIQFINTESIASNFMPVDLMNFLSSGDTC